MRNWILTRSNTLQLIIIIFGTIISAFIIANLCSLFFDMHELELNDELTASVYQVMGTVYAILLTFTLWGVWQNFTEAIKSVQQEANALLDLVHMTRTTNAEDDEMKKAALQYSHKVMHEEWPTLKVTTSESINREQAVHGGCEIIVNMIRKLAIKTGRDEMIYAQSLSLLTRWLDARRTRLLMARGNSARTLWPLLFTGAFVLFAYHGLFVAKTLGIWSALLFGISLVIGVTFYLIFALDAPFSGFFCIDAEPFAFMETTLTKMHV